MLSKLRYVALFALLPAAALAARSETPAISTINIFQAIVLGMVQGLTEFIPISSTAHLKVVPVFLHWGDPGVSFAAVIQLGSIVAVLHYFRKDLWQLAKGSWQALRSSDYRDRDLRVSFGIAIGTIPIVVCGLALKFLTDYENSFLRSLTSIALASIVMSLLLAIAEKVGKRTDNFEKLGTREGILMGVAQALALVPGVSRSGSTITAGLFMGLNRETAARFSFLLGIPAITLAGLIELKEIFDPEVATVSPLVMAIGLISSTVFSYLAIAWLIRFLQTRNTWIFVWYRLLFGAIVLVAIFTGWI